MPIRAQDLATAYKAVAEVNHYMVGITEPTTLDELLSAETILIDEQNACPLNKQWEILELALDLIEHDRRQASA